MQSLGETRVVARQLEESLIACKTQLENSPLTLDETQLASILSIKSFKGEIQHLEFKSPEPKLDCLIGQLESILKESFQFSTV